MAATFTLALGLALQAAVLTLYLAVRDRTVLVNILRNWRPSLAAGFLGALASQFWYLAFAVATAASVRTLALVEVLFAQAIATFVFRQKTTPREALGIVLVVAGVALPTHASAYTPINEPSCRSRIALLVGLGRCQPAKVPRTARSVRLREHAAADLVELHGLEQRLEVAVAEAFVALALNQLEEDRPDDRFREDLEQQPALAVVLVLAWKTAGWIGLDRWLLPVLGTPWRPGLIRRRARGRASDRAPVGEIPR